MDTSNEAKLILSFGKLRTEQNLQYPFIDNVKSILQYKGANFHCKISHFKYTKTELQHGIADKEIIFIF